jgi:hypothetical protein
MTEPTKLLGLTSEEINAYLNAISQRQPDQIIQSSYTSKKKQEQKVNMDDRPQYFYDISTNCFIG